MHSPDAPASAVPTAPGRGRAPDEGAGKSVFSPCGAGLRGNRAIRECGDAFSGALLRLLRRGLDRGSDTGYRYAAPGAAIRTTFRVFPVPLWRAKPPRMTNLNLHKRLESMMLESVKHFSLRAPTLLISSDSSTRSVAIHTETPIFLITTSER